MSDDKDNKHLTMDELLIIKIKVIVTAELLNAQLHDCIVMTRVIISGYE